MARMFHETYERLAPEYGYEMRPDTRVFEPDSATGKLMTAVCTAMMEQMEKQLNDGFQMPAVQNEESVKFLAGKVNEIAAGKWGQVDAVGLILCNTENPEVRFTTHRIDPKGGAIIFRALLQQAEQAMQRTPGGLIIPH